MIHKPASAEAAPRSEGLLLYMIIGCGILLRAFHYFDNRSLWEDEVFLASSLIHMDFGALATQPLEYMQRAPVGFLWLVRLSVVFFGQKEMALRLVPFFGGILSIIAFVPVARYFLKSNVAVLTAVALVAFAPPLIYHAVEVKQYGIEFLASVVSLYLYTRFQGSRAIPKLVIWGLAGAAILWLSFSSLFILFGIAGAVGLRDLIRKDWKTLFLHMIPFGVWLVSFAIQYILFISHYPQEEWLVQFWRNREAFMPLPPHSLSDVLWPFRQIYALIRYPMGLSWIELDYTIPYTTSLRILARFPFVAIGIGLFGMWRLFSREKGTLLLWSMPVLLALAASSFEFYPIRERLTVFLAPIFLLVIGKGIEHMQRLSWPAFVKTAVLVILIAAPVCNSGFQVINTDYFGDYKKSRQRESMQYLQTQYSPEDVVYVFWNNLPSYLYYEEVYGLKFNVVYGSDPRSQSTDFQSYFKNMEPDFAKLEGHKKVWYFYKPYNGLKLGDIENEPKWYYENVNAFAKVLSHMSRFGELKSSYPAPELATDVRVALFERK